MEYPKTPFSITGGTWPANIWARFASEALQGVPYGDLATIDTDAYVTVVVDTPTGFLSGPLCPRQHNHTLRLPLGAAPSVVCPIHHQEGLGLVEAGKTPNVVGLDLAAAVDSLTTNGHSATIRWADEPGAVAGTVLRQDPAPAAQIDPGGAVALVVAGPEPGVVVPGVLGRPAAEATAALAAAGIEHQVLTLAEEDPALAAARRGIVWKQEPAGGAPAGGVVTLWVNP
jgi:hypothetical protein